MTFCKKASIARVDAREVLDSRGNPTVEAIVVLDNGIMGCAMAPSGASTGKYEAHELRDGDKKRYGGKGVLTAVENIRTKIHEELQGMPVCQSAIDTAMIRLDDTENKKRLGANAILAVSLAAAKAGAAYQGVPLYRYIGGIHGTRLPTPMMNILNGGAHASNNVDIQEFMILPVGFSTFREALRAGVEIYHTLGKRLKAAGKSTGVGDEGGYAPDMQSDDEVLTAITEAIIEAGYTTEQVKIALDAASSEWADGDRYTFPKAGGSADAVELVNRYQALAERYPVVSIEDGLGEDDHRGWKSMTERLGGRMMLVGDDYFVTNPKKLKEGIENHCGNAILVKPNQIGTVTETIAVVNLAKEHGYRTILSHRSGETGDTSIADLAVGLNAGFIKTGAPCRGERTEKYNRLLTIGEELRNSAVYGNNI
ncbi:MAG: phosphopyruvate hydratase [Clostridia bacterium]|nr:phosphopyruvate hydratase [Clostridia bacterium]